MSSSSSSYNNNNIGQFPTLCDCKNPLPLVLRKSTTLTHPARRFLCCPHPSWSGNKCKAYYFVDPELPTDYYKCEMFNLTQQVGRQNKQSVQTENTKIAEVENEMNLLKTELMIMQKECKECRTYVVFYKRVVLFLFAVVFMYLVK